DAASCGEAIGSLPEGRRIERGGVSMTSQDTLPEPSSARARVGAFVDSDRFQRVVIAVICFNAVILGFETSPRAMATAGPLLMALDSACLVFFVFEIALKLFARRLA